MIDKKEAPIPLAEKDLTFWRQEIKMARQKREEIASTYGWEDNLARYTPKAAKDANNKPNADVNTGADFRDVERKKAALFYDTPTVGLTVTQDRPIVPKTPEEEAILAQLGKPLELSTLVSFHGQMLNELLGPQHANIKPTVLEAIFNCLCPAGVGPVTVGYQVTMTKIDREQPVIDPLTQQAVMQPVSPLATAMAAMGLAPPVVPEPLMETVKVEVPIHERWFVSTTSPKALLIPASYKSTQHQRAPWLGYDWRKPLSQVRREYHLPKDWQATADEETKTSFEGPGDAHVDDEAAGDPYVTGVDLYYRTAIRSETEEHPEAMRHLVLVDGKDEPVVHRDSPYQDFTETGELTPGSLMGFCVRPLVLRQLTDSAWVPSDCAVTAQLTKEGEKYRTQIIEQRDGNKMVIAFDSGKMDPTATDKIKKANGVIWVPLQEGALAQGKDSIMQQVAQPTLGRETYAGMDVIDSDREQILGIGRNQTGIQSKGRKTATEQTIVQRNSEARFEQERQAVLEWFVDVVSAFDTLVLRYADERIAVQILGEARGKLWAMFKGNLAGGYGYNLHVDSGKYLDIEADRRQILQFYNQVRQDPFINPRLILKEMAEKFGYDAAEFIVEPEKPQKDLKASIAIKGEHLDPALPQFALMVSLLRQGGWEISEADVQMAQQQAQAQTGGMMPISGVGPDPKAAKNGKHPGAAEKAPTINQHLAEETGERPGPRVGVM